MIICATYTSKFWSAIWTLMPATWNPVYYKRPQRFWSSYNGEIRSLAIHNTHSYLVSFFHCKHQKNVSATVIIQNSIQSIQLYAEPKQILNILHVHLATQGFSLVRWLGRWYVCVLHRGSNCSPSRAMDGRIMRHGIISSCQSDATSEIVKRCCSSLVSSAAIASTQTFTFTFLPFVMCSLVNFTGSKVMTAEHSTICLNQFLQFYINNLTVIFSSLNALLQYFYSRWQQKQNIYYSNL